MRKNLLRIAFIAIVAMVTACGSSKKTTSSDNVDKSAKEYIREQIAEWKADGYRRSGAGVTYSLEELMVRHRSKMETEPKQYFELYGIANGGGKSHLSALKMSALNDAAREYASKSGMEMKGKMGSHFNTLSEDVKDVLTGSFIAEISTKIMPFFEESFAIEKVTPTSMELRVYYIIDETKAAKARKEAAAAAVNKNAESVSDGQALLKEIEQAVKSNPLAE
ncbi:MAG: hypothetical protein SNH35_04230 [Rikenellaceae bacterium]